MFFDSERITCVREMIVASDIEGRKKAIRKLLPFQKKDFIEIFEIMEGLPVTIRLLDPPLHEFIPHRDEEYETVAKSAGISVDKVKSRCQELIESNPMLGHRGCRLAITYPELYEMQAQAIFEAAVEVQQSGKKVIPEIMIPIVLDRKEITILKKLIDEVAQKIFKDKKAKVEYLVGTMIELPRAALQASNIALDAEFFSFGTNDLTQTTLGISRDDAGSFIPAYIEKGIFEKDPFAVLDVEGVGELINIAVERGRKSRKDIKLGICGEHGGNPASIEFCQNAGLNYVSCSPFRVPIARLASAQAKIKSKAKLKKAA
jgi:pyruvate,orthophosphate dikinase